MINRITIVLTIIITLVMFGTITITQYPTYAQIPGLTTSSPPPPASSTSQNQQQSQNSSSASFVTYKDPQGRFSIDYLSNWTATAATNRFEKTLVSFTGGYGTMNFATVGVIMENNPPPLGLEETVKLLLSSFRNTTPNFDLNQGVECQKYTFDGNQACSIIYSRTTDYTSNIKIAVLAVFSQVNGHTYVISYQTLPDNFDKLLPTVDQMIGSFRSG